LERTLEKVEIGSRRYLGSKAKLLEFINKVVETECERVDSFADIFGGTGNVAWSFNDGKRAIIINDILESNYLSYICFFDSHPVDSKKVENLIRDFNEANPTEENYFSKNFSGTFFDLKNSQKIGFIRDGIELLFKAKTINYRERAILITSLIYAMDRIANTVGHYDAFRRTGQLNRTMKLKMPAFDTSKNGQNRIFKMDANQLVEQIKADLVYIDPPYNSRQYCDAYHLLENVAMWEKPEVVGVAKKMKGRQSLKSNYCTLKAPAAFSELIDKIQSKYILVSYNNTGEKGAGRSQAKISDEDILKALHKKGEVKTFEIEHNQFNAGKKNEFFDHKERLFLCIVGPESKHSVSERGKGFAKSPLNYTGGKFKLLPRLVELFPKNIHTFIDLFGGGFNVGANIEAKRTIYNEKQKEIQRLIHLFYKHNYVDIIAKVENIVRTYSLSNTFAKGYGFYGCESDGGVGKYNKPFYLKLRDDYNDIKENSEEKDFLLLTLIIYSFNNQIRFNSEGLFNMPVGKRDFNSSTKKNIKNFCLKVSNLDCSFLCSDFRNVNTAGFRSPFLYCDPPYFLGIAAYNENDGWTEKDERDLIAFLLNESQKGHQFALSNVIEHKGKKHTMLIEWALENGFNVIHLKSSYRNSNYQLKDKKADTDKVLITNY